MGYEDRKGEKMKKKFKKFWKEWGITQEEIGIFVSIGLIFLLIFLLSIIEGML